MAMPDGAAGNFLKNILGATNQFFAQHNQIQVVSRMTAQMQAGRWILKAPFGYENYHHPVEGKIIRPKQSTSDIVKEMLINYSVGNLKTIADAQRFLSLKINTSDYQKNYRNKQASRILNNALFYAGHIRYKRKDKILPFKVWDIDTKGIHKPLITMETAYKILERLKKKERIYDTSKKDLFPLKTNILCFGCGSKMTANHSTGKSKKKFGYYRCNNFKCNYPKKNINQTFAEQKFSDFLKSIEFDNSYKNFVSSILDKILKENKYKDTTLKRKLTKSINELEISKKHLLDKLSDENFYSIQQDIVNKIDSINLDIKNANKSLNSLKDRYSHKFYLDQVLDLFTNLNNHWSTLNVESKRNLQNLLFPDGFSINLEGEITTPQICVPFARFKDNSDKKSNLVEPRGIEPLTSTLPA